MKLVFVCLAVTLQLVLGSSLPNLVQPLSPEQVERLNNWTNEDQQNKWQLSGQFEGDIILTPNQRNGEINEKYRWTNRELVYSFDADVSEANKTFIRETLKEYAEKTCIKPREKTDSDTNYVLVSTEFGGCWSYIGMLGGKQQMNLSYDGCMIKGTILHEFMHALGFYHQQSATERDDYVTIMWENIWNGTELNFQKYDSSIISSFNAPYDFGSIMHYDAYAFSSNGEKTIVTKNNEFIGQHEDLSNIDLYKINFMYSCHLPSMP